MTYVLDGLRFEDKESAFDHMIEVLDLPPYTGHNLDGLWDVLSERGSLDIEIIHGRWIYRYLGTYGLRLLDVLSDLNQYDQCRLVIFW